MSIQAEFLIEPDTIDYGDWTDRHFRVEAKIDKYVNGPEEFTLELYLPSDAKFKYWFMSFKKNSYTKYLKNVTSDYIEMRQILKIRGIFDAPAGHYPLKKIGHGCGIIVIGDWGMYQTSLGPYAGMGDYMAAYQVYKRTRGEQIIKIDRMRNDSLENFYPCDEVSEW